MPLVGDYEPSSFDFARNQVERIESSGGSEGTDNQGAPVIVLTSVGAKSGKLRKTPLMRVEHDGEYAVVASLGWRAQAPGLVLQRGREPAGGVAGRPGEEGLPGA